MMFLYLWCGFAIKIRQTIQYMKEALLHNQPFHHQILDAYQENNTKYFSNKRRRGQNPILTRKQDADSFLKYTNKTNVMQEREVSYPFSALGTVQSIFEGQVKKGIGAIIHRNLIMALSNISKHICQNKNEMWFIPFQKQQRIPVKKVHPSYLKRKISNKDGDINEIICIILQLDRKVNLQAYLGSFSINFIKQPSKQALILGININQDKYRIFQDSISTRFNQNIVTYSLQGRKYPSGSLIVNQYQGQYQIIGIHVQSKQDEGLGIHLSKQIWSQFSKLTFKGGWLNLSHEKIGRKAANYLKQLKLKKLTQLQLMNSAVGNEEINMISQLNCSLKSLNLGYNKIRDDSLLHLKKSQWDLQHLLLTKNLITYQSIQTLSCISWKNMTCIELNQNRIGSKGACLLSKCDWRNLQLLNLNRTQMDDAACDKLRRGRWPHLTTLQLDHNQVTLFGVFFLSNAHWRMLQCLSLAFNRLNYDGVKQSIRGNWPKLRIIRVEYNRMNLCEKQAKIRKMVRDKFRCVSLTMWGCQ